MIESDAFFIQHTGKLNFSTMELGKEVKVEYPRNLQIGDIPKGDETKSLKFAHFFSLTNAQPRTPDNRHRCANSLMSNSVEMWNVKRENYTESIQADEIFKIVFDGPSILIKIYRICHALQSYQHLSTINSPPIEAE